MEPYISKAALVAEIKRLITELVEEGEDTMFEQGRISAFEDIKVFINHTLEVEEVDLNNAVERYIEQHKSELNGYFDIRRIARHFFELGLKAQNKNIWHPMSESPDHSCSVLMHGYGNNVWIADAVETLEKGAAQEWAYMDDVLKTLGLKAHKGE